MIEKRYFKRMWEEEYYIFDSQQISEKDFDEKVEYEDYQAFADSMMGDEVVDVLNELHEENQRLKSIEDGFEFSCTEKPGHFDKDKLYVKDTHTKIHLDGRNLFIEVYIPQTDEFYRFKYAITGKSLMREFTENYNPKGDDGMTEKEVTIDLNELNIDIRKEIIFKSDLNAWIERKMSYYEGMMEKTDGSNYVNAKGHLDMLIVLKEWIKQR